MTSLLTYFIQKYKYFLSSRILKTITQQYLIMYQIPFQDRKLCVRLLEKKDTLMLLNFFTANFLRLRLISLYIKPYRKNSSSRIKVGSIGSSVALNSLLLLASEFMIPSLETWVRVMSWISVLSTFEYTTIYLFHHVSQ